MDDDRGRTIETVTAQGCRSIGNVRPVKDLELLAEPSGPWGARLVAAHRRSMDEAAAVLARLVEEHRAAELPDRSELLDVIDRVATTNPARLTTIAVGKDGIEIGSARREITPFGAGARTDPDGTGLRRAAAFGGLVVTNAERESDRLNALAALAARAAASTATVRIAVGHAARGLMDPARRTVFAVGGPVTVHTIGGDTWDLPEGGAHRGDDVTGTVNGPGGVAVIVETTAATEQFGITVAMRKAGHLPRLRADMPADVHAPVRVYGVDHEVDFTALFNEQAAALFSEETSGHAIRWWRANAIPVMGSGRWRLTYPDDPAGWPPTLVTGRVPAGFAMAQRFDNGLGLVAAAHHFDVLDHMLPVLELLLDGATRPLDELSVECPDGDPWCTHRALETLAGLGLVHLEERSG